MINARITIVFIFTLFALASCLGKEDPFSSFEGRTMGTTYHIKVVPKLTGKAESRLFQNIQQILKRINNQMSTYQKRSEISRLNALTAGQSLTLSPELYGVMMRSMDINRETKGAFDVTVGPLVNLWGFGAQSTKRKTMPSVQQIEAVKAYTGINLIKIDSKNKTIEKRLDNVYVDLAAIAKGYGVDAVSAYLQETGITDYMVEIGGEVKVSGVKDKKNNKKWKIAVEKPLAGKRENGRILSVKDISIATSGDYRNYFEYNGKRYSHTINPVTGYPVAHNLASVSVFAARCMDADAYATALMVMGESHGLEFADEKKIKVIFYVHHNGTYTEVLSKEMVKYLETL